MDFRLPFVFLVAIIGSTVQSTTGFGCGIILMLVLPSLLPLLKASAVSSAICIVLTITIAVRNHKYVSLKKLLMPCVLYVIASSFSIRISSSLNLRLLVLSFGVFLIGLSIYFFCGGNKASYPDSPLTMVVISVVSGATGGLFGIGGPLLAPYFLKLTDSKEEYVGTMQTLFSVSTVVGFVVRVRSGIYTMELVPVTLCGFVGVILGYILGLWVFRRINASMVSKLVYTLMGLCGVLTIAVNY